MRMMKATLLLSFVLSSSCRASLFRPTTKPATLPAFLPRGGGVGGLSLPEPAMAAKIYGGLQLVQGVVQTLSPSTYSDVYGLKEDNSACNQKMIREQGIHILQQGLMAYLLLAKELSTEEAGGIVSLAVVAERLSSLLNDDSEMVGPSKQVDLLGLAVSGACAVAGLCGLGWATTALKVSGVFHVVFCGLPLMTYPEKMCSKVVELKKTNALTSPIARGLGWTKTSTGALFSCLAWGASTATSFGASMVVTAVSAAKYFISNSDGEVLGVKKAAVVAWTIIPALLAASIFLDSD